MRWLSWRAVVAFISLAGALAAAGAAGYLQLTSGADPIIQADHGDKAWAVSIITTVAVLSALTRFVRVLRLPGVENRGRRVASALRSLNKEVAKVVEDDKKADKLGASAYVVRGWGPVQWLHRIERERVADLPVPSGITWRPGKGVIGLCVSQSKEQNFDAGAFKAKYRKYTKEQWKKLDRDTRMDLRYDEFQRIHDKYGTVIAVPMMKGERVIGCVSFDAPEGLHRHLKDADVVDAVAAAAATVAGIVG